MPRTRSTVSHPSALHSTITDIKEGSIPPSIALGKRKRAKSQQRSPSPARTDSGLAEPKRKRGRPTKTEAEKRRAQSLGPPVASRAVRAGSLGPPVRNRAQVLPPQRHRRPSRPPFIWGDGDRGNFGFGADS